MLNWLELQTQLSLLQEAVHQLACDKGWWDDATRSGPSCDGIDRYPTVVLSKLALIHSEVSEAVEAVRDSKYEVRLEEDRFGQQKPEGLEAELADVVIRTLDLAEALGFNLGRAIVQKYEFNRTRAHRHGGRAA